MKVLLSWLRDYVDVPYSVEELEERLPMLGLGVDSVERLGEDAVFDLELAANRGDLMSLMGVSRELAAAGGTTVRLPAVQKTEVEEAVADRVALEVLDEVLCPRFTARMIVDVRVGASPAWLARRLEASGVRSINNIVDVTNYVMLEMGQPMHAFDYDLLRGGRLIVRHARPGERLVTLDGVERSLDEQTLVVADAERAAGVAGIIGGANTEISDRTTRVLLEAASWDSRMIRRTSRRLGVRTESSARFERGIDTAGILAVQERAIALMQELAGGRVLRGVLDIYPRPLPPRSVRLRWAAVRRLLGIEVPIDEGMAILRGLGFDVRRADAALDAAVPSYRRDVEREEDLIEEVARHYGYEKIPETLPLEVTATGTRVPSLVAEEAARRVLIRAGLTEVLSVSLTRPEALDALRLSGDHPLRHAVRLTNPLVEDHTQMRTTLLPALLDIARTNVNRRVADVQIFEMGRVFHPDGPRAAEPRRVGILITGHTAEGTWNTPAEWVAVTFYHLKGVAESLLAELRVDAGAFAPGAAPWLHPGRAAVLSVEADPLGLLGQLHPEIAASFDLPEATYVAEFDLDRLLAAANLRPQYRPLPRYPAVRRDLAVVVTSDLPARAVQEAVVRAGGTLLDGIELFDAYTGTQIPVGRRSLAYAITFRAPDRTLSAAEVDVAIAAIKRALTEGLQAQIRD
ncbi:MAG TPA: phenylalanine--tRNA ligase subunit beta [bacterium]|nr:phenylalanine--tRNA ligase subunit beta [bacterium]